MRAEEKKESTINLLQQQTQDKEQPQIIPVCVSLDEIVATKD